jgi:hypothetical protein
VPLKTTNRNVEVFLFRIEQGTGYAGGDPINRSDPSGLDSYWDWFQRTCNGDPATCLVDYPPADVPVYSVTGYGWSDELDNWDVCDMLPPGACGDNQTARLRGDGPSGPPKNPGQLQNELTYAVRQAGLDLQKKPKCATLLGGGVVNALSILQGLTATNQYGSISFGTGIGTGLVP